MLRRTMITTMAGAAAGAGAAEAAAPRRSGRRPAGTVDVGEASLHVRDWGEGRPVVFLSAWGFSSEAWQYQMVPLSQQGLRCVAYDRRGHGRSSDPGRGYDYCALADDLAGVLEALDLRDVVLVAYSMAAGEAVRYLTRHGRSRVARVLLLAPTTPFLMKTADNPDGVDPAAFAASRATMARDFPAALDAGFGTFIDQGASEPLKAWAKSLMLQCSLKALIDCQRAFAETDFRAELARLTLPVMVIQGDADRSAPLALTGRKTAALIRNSQLKVYPGAPHGLVFTHTERLNADLAAFARG
jgi:non-heme chloroperoxidase